MTNPYESWQAANQRHLNLMVSRVRQYLLPDGPDARLLQALESELRKLEELELEKPLAAQELRAVFGLSAFEMDVLILCAGVEFAGSFEALLERPASDGRSSGASFVLALKHFPGAHRSALAPTGPLRSWRLVELDDGPTLASSPLRIDERILHGLTGSTHLDQRLNELAVSPETEELAPSHVVIAERIQALWRHEFETDSPSIVQLLGVQRSTSTAIAARVCRELGLRPWVVSVRHLPTSAQDMEKFRKLWQRESLLADAVMILEDVDDSFDVAARMRVFDRWHAPLLLVGLDRAAGLLRAPLCFCVEAPTVDERRALWKASLPQGVTGLDGDIARVAEHFRLGAREIRSLCEQALGAYDGANSSLGQQLWDTCRAHARPRLDGLVERLESSAEPAECVLSGAAHAKLQELTAQVRRRPQVHERLGVEAGERGLLCLFAGGDAASKIHAAQSVARELEVDLYRLDLGRLANGYGGGMQRRVRSVFDTAAECGAALLIEGTELLSGSRRSVDELELLEQLERYSGLAILTAERVSDVDPALTRSLGCVVDFELPGTEQRAEIWRRVLAQYPVVANVDYGDLARLEVAVDQLRTVALDAAYLAAEAGEALGLEHVRRAAGLEMEVSVPDVSLLG